MKLAIIDCGTNTFNLIIIELSDSKKYKKLHSTRISVKLGESTINEGYIAEKPFKRGLDAIASFNHDIRKFDGVKVLAFATSAIRDAKNGTEFVNEVKEQTGISIQVIDGIREAELIYLGIKEAVKMDGQVSLIMDIGGGSTEFILCNKDQIFWKHSFNIGAARLLEKFKHSDPIQSSEIQEVNNYLAAQLAPLKEAAAKIKPVELIGSSGAFESFIEMNNGEFGGEFFTTDKTEYRLNPDDYAKVSALVKNCTSEERRRIKGLVPMRFDMIVISCMMVDFVLEQLNIKNIRVSTYSLKEGALVDYINSIQ